MSNDTLYRKVGRRYVPAGVEFTGWPANGVWLVEDGRQGRIAKLGEVPEPAPLAAVERHRDRITDAVRRAVESHARGTFKVDWEAKDARWEWPSLHDVVTAIVKELAKGD